MSAPNGNTYAEGNEGGRPTKFKKEYSQQAYKLTLLGATDEELASFFEVHKDTITEWKNSKKEFSASIKRGKAQADANVAEKLYTRAMGYSYKEVSFEKVGTKDELDAETNEVIATDLYRKKIVIKEVSPDTTAQIFWLKNRTKNRSDAWKDKSNIGLDFEKWNDEMLDKAIQSLTEKAIQQSQEQLKS